MGSEDAGSTWADVDEAVPGGCPARRKEVGLHGPMGLQRVAAAAVAATAVTPLSPEICNCRLTIRSRRARMRHKPGSPRSSATRL
jgi:hypothetical protein